jgi:hypothetical protein
MGGVAPDRLFHPVPAAGQLVLENGEPGIEVVAIENPAEPGPELEGVGWTEEIVVGAVTKDAYRLTDPGRIDHHE